MGRRGKVGDFGPTGWVWWLVSGSVDFRCGVDRLLVHVREVLERHERQCHLAPTFDELKGWLDTRKRVGRDSYKNRQLR